MITHPRDGQCRPFFSTDILQFAACLSLSLLMAAGVMGWMNQHARFGASAARQRAESFADWYCARPQAPCIPQLVDMLAQPATETQPATRWRFRFQLGADRDLRILVDATGRVTLENPPAP